jgi:hypothetical protein
VPVQRRHGNRLSEPEAMQVDGQRILSGIVDLVRDQEHRLPRATQDVGDLFVPRRHAGLCVEDEEDEVGLCHRLLRLSHDRACQRRAVGDVDAAGVDEQEAPAAPFADELLSVTRDTRRLVNDGGPRPREPVHEGRLADVREADNRHRPEQRLLRLAHAGGVATRGRPASIVRTRKSNSFLISPWISSEAAR